MSSGLYALGFLVVIVGVVYMAHLMHLPQVWIGAIVLVLVGVGIVSVSQTMKKG